MARISLSLVGGGGSQTSFGAQIMTTIEDKKPMSMQERKVCVCVCIFGIIFWDLGPPSNNV